MTIRKILEIDAIDVALGGQSILNAFSLDVSQGKVHAIMGPNGSGKSTLAYTIMGKPGYEISHGSIRFFGEDISKLDPDERAARGIFLAFQYPVEIPGVNNAYFLRAALNSLRKQRGLNEIDAVDFLELIKDHLSRLKMDQRFLHRAINEGFSGGEKKRNEILQMSVLEPRLCILDETDSGLDIDALKVCADGVNALRNEERSMIVVTHYQRLLDFLVPDVVHVMVNGRIVESGDKDLAKTLEMHGYDYFIKKAQNGGLEVIRS